MSWSSRRRDFGLVRGWQPAGGSFDPAAFGTVLAYWDFTDLATLTFNGSDIVQANDKKTGGTARNLTGTVGAAPTHTAFGSTGKLAATFDGVDNRLTYTTDLSAFKVCHDDSATGGTIVVWALNSTTGSTLPILDSGGWTSATVGCAIAKTSTEKIQALVSNGTAARGVATTGSTTSGTPFVGSLRWQGDIDTLKTRLDGAGATDSTAYTPSAASATTFLVGANSALTLFFSGKIARMVIFSGSLSDSVMAQIEAAIIQ